MPSGPLAHRRKTNSRNPRRSIGSLTSMIECARASSAIPIMSGLSSCRNSRILISSLSRLTIRKARKVILEGLIAMKVPFVDVGIDAALDKQSSLRGMRVGSHWALRVVHGHIREVVSFADGLPNEIYCNIQVADLNMLNASMAVMKWKKLRGFYADDIREHHSLYTVATHGLTKGGPPMRADAMRPEYVEFIPKALEDGVIYISKEFKTASHLCCCGCGTKIVTPLRETEYTLIEQGPVVSLYPSIGNWNHPCQSHYWIREGRVVWAGRMSSAEIRRGRAHDDRLKEAYFAQFAAKPWWRRSSLPAISTLVGEQVRSRSRLLRTQSGFELGAKLEQKSPASYKECNDIKRVPSAQPDRAKAVSEAEGQEVRVFPGPPSQSSRCRRVFLTERSQARVRPVFNPATIIAYPHEQAGIDHRRGWSSA